MALHFGGLRKKVLKNNFIIILLVVIIFDLLFIIYVQNYYYNSVRQTLESQVDYTKGVYNTTGNIDISTFENKINNIFEKQKAEKNPKFGISVIDVNKKVILDQYGFKTNEDANFVDVDRALTDSKELYPIVYKDPISKEHLMSVSVPIKVNNMVQGAVRYTVSLKNLDKEIRKIITWIAALGVFVLAAAVGLSFKFANTLIEPISDLKTFANNLVKGNYSMQIDKAKIQDDEIGDLADTFEHMASEIEKTNKLKDEFISSVSHELRTPLTSLKGWSETLLQPGTSDEEYRLGLGMIFDETERLISLVEELLDFSKVSRGQSMVFGNVNVESLVIDVVNQLRVKAVEKNIRLLFEFETENMYEVEADKNKLKQVLINIVQNSLKFTEKDGFIKIIVNQTEKDTFFTIEDNGIGISKENLSKVKEKFFQEDFNKSGSGLGLAISSEIVKQHGGEINISSEKGIGTLVVFNIKNKQVAKTTKIKNN